MTTALVTGASAGLGAALALELARRGDDLVLTARSEIAVAEECRNLGAEVTTVRCDLRDPAQVQELASFAHVDLAILNAATLGRLAPISELTAADWSEVLATDLVSVAGCLQFLLPEMTARGHGTVVAVSSSAAVLARPTMAMYSAAKAALETLMKTAANEVEGTGVRVHAIRPGAIDTPMQGQLREGDSALAEGSRRAAEAGLLHAPATVAARLLDRIAEGTRDVVLDLGA